MASKGKRWLIGCGLGCLVVIAVIVAVIISFTLWVRGSGELLEPQKLLGSDTTGYLEWSLRMEDEGTQGFARELIRAMQEIPPEASNELPPWIYNWLSKRQSDEAERDVLQLFPMVAAWTVRPGETEDDDLHLLSVSVQRLGNRLVFGDWVMGWFLHKSDDVTLVRHRDEKIYQTRIKDDTSATFFIRGGNLFFTSDPETARVAVDRLIADAAPSREATNLDRLFGETTGPLRGAIDNQRGEMLRVWSSISALSGASVDPDLWNGFSGLALSGGVQADGSLAATLRFHGEKAWIEDRALDLVMALHEGFSWGETEADVQARPFDGGLEVELKVPGLTETLGGWIRFDREIETDSGTVRIDF